MTKKKKIAIIIIVILVLIIIFNANTIRILFGNWFGHKEALETGDWDGGKSYMNVQYSTVSQSDYLHLFVPESDKPLPLFIMVHGGGFFYNDLDSRQAALFYQKVRNKGYAVATINYRLGDEANYPAAIEDVKAAVRFLRANADTYGLDSEHFVIAGESAGGYLACMAAVTSDEEFNDGQNGEVSGKVQGLVDFYGCMEFYTFDEQFEELKVPKLIRSIGNSWLSDVTKGTGADSVEEVWIGKTVSEMTEEERQTYTVPYYAKQNLNIDTDLQVVILHGDADITVPYLQSEEFYELACKLLGSDKVTYRLFHNYGHAADGFYSEDTIDWILEQFDMGD
jgi:acetyl esterase/lipase